MAPIPAPTRSGAPGFRHAEISLEVLAKMTGFPIEMIKEEVFKGQEGSEVSLEDLRTAMLSYIDSTMLND